MPRSNAALKIEVFGGSRREEYAEATRQAILDAARVLFSEKGYFATKVDEIAGLARVAPATVYAVTGGKQGLLRTLVDGLSADPIVAETFGRIAQMDNPAAIVRLVAQVCRRMREEFGDTLRVMVTTAPHDPKIAEIQAEATVQYRAAFVPVAQRLRDLGGLRDGMDVPQAVDVFWFYFGYTGLLVLHDNNCWSYARAEQWLCEEASHALLRNPPLRVARAATP
jgi:AcrR family transcriptional regulator